MYGLSGHGLALGNLYGSHEYFAWAKWAWLGDGQLYLGPVYISYGLCGHGLELGTLVGSQLHFVLAKWVWATGGNVFLGPICVLYTMNET